MAIKKIWHVAYGALALATVAWAGWQMIMAATLPAGALCLVAGAPMVQRFFPFDTPVVAHHKVRLPKVSLLVFLGLGALLLTAAKGLVLWLALVNVGGFLLDTYWACVEEGGNSGN